MSTDTDPLKALGLRVDDGERPSTSRSRTGAAAKDREAGSTSTWWGLGDMTASTVHVWRDSKSCLDIYKKKKNNERNYDGWTVGFVFFYFVLPVT